MAAEIYVYYKLRADRAAEAQAAFDAARGDAPVRLLSRGAAAPGAALLTWMEIYAPEQPEAEARIAAALAPFVEGSRQRECFTPLPLL